MTDRLKQATIATVVTGQALRAARAHVEVTQTAYRKAMEDMGQAMMDNSKAQLAMEHALDEEPPKEE